MSSIGTIVIIPAHNEASNIAEVILRTRAASPTAYILVVDDGSTDATAEIATRTGAKVIMNPSWAEYGHGFMAGMDYALLNKYRTIVFMDAGLSHQPEDIPRLIEALNDYDVVIGSRVMAGAIYKQVWWRKLLTFVAVRAFALAMRSNIMDYSSFRAFSGTAAHKIAVTGMYKSMKAHAFNPQLLARMKRMDYNIKQVPITYIATNSTLNWRGFLEAIKGLFYVAKS